VSVAAIVARRRRALLDTWKRDPLVMVQVESTAALAGFSFLEEFSGPGAVRQLGRRQQGSVGYWHRPGNPDTNASLWVASVYGSYKSAYVSFVRTVYGIAATTADLAGYDVDHLLNRARSPQDSTFIRVEAVPSDVNQRWGALFERAASHPSFYANQHRERRNMSWMVATKLAGQMPPLGPDDRAGIDRIVQFWVGEGYPLAEARSGIESMLNFAYRRP
jgi:hypothetical protein